MIPSTSPYADRPSDARAGFDGGAGRPPRPDVADGETQPVFRALCGLMARTQITRVRVLTLLGLSALAILSGVAYGHGVRIGVVKQPLVSGANWVDEFGLGFVVPVATLLFASSMFGDPNDDKTLVYLWLRPVARSRITRAAAVTSYIATWPLVVPALATMAACTGGGRNLVVGTVVSASVGIAAYTGVFVLLGARVRQPLVWGLLYIIMWEKYVATASAVARAVSLRSYGASILNDFTGTKLILDFLPLVPAVIVPLVISAVALAYCTRYLARQDVA